MGSGTTRQDPGGPAGTGMSGRSCTAIHLREAVVRVEEIAPMMLMTSTQTAYLRPWTTTRGSGGALAKVDPRQLEL